MKKAARIFMSPPLLNTRRPLCRSCIQPDTILQAYACNLTLPRLCHHYLLLQAGCRCTLRPKRTEESLQRRKSCRYRTR